MKNRLVIFGQWDATFSACTLKFDGWNTSLVLPNINVISMEGSLLANLIKA